MSRAICTTCGKTVSWSAQRGSRLNTFRHFMLMNADGSHERKCEGHLTAWTEKAEARMTAHLLGLVDSRPIVGSSNTQDQP